MDSTTRSRTGHMKNVVLITLITAVGGFLFGFDNGAISGSTGFLQERFGLGSGGIGWVTSCIIVGCIIGVVVAGRLSDLVGRKKVLLATAVVFLVGAVGEALAPNVDMLVAARMLVGIGIGIETTIAPLYIAEVAPSHLRGRMVSFNQLFNTVGNLVVFTVSALISRANSESWNVEHGWRYVFGVGVVPAVLFFCLLFIVPESPRWLIGHGREDLGRAVLRRINPTDRDADRQFDEIRATLGQEGGAGLRDLWAPRLRKALVIGFGVALFQQITGINAIFYYAPEVFKDAGLETNDALSSTVLIGVTLVLATLVSLWIVDRVGRRTLLLFGATGMTITLACTGLLFRAASPNPTLLLVFILGYVAVFAVSFGTVAYIIISEIFPSHVRGVAASVATFALWGGNYLVSQFFPVLVDHIGSSGTFFIFAGTSLVALVFTFSMVPETKNKTLEEVERELYGTGPALPATGTIPRQP